MNKEISGLIYIARDYVQDTREQLDELRVQVLQLEKDALSQDEKA